MSIQHAIRLRKVPCGEGREGKERTCGVLKVGLLVVERGALELELVLEPAPVVGAGALLGDVLVHAVLGLRAVLVEGVGVGCARGACHGGRWAVEVYVWCESDRESERESDDGVDEGEETWAVRII